MSLDAAFLFAKKRPLLPFCISPFAAKGQVLNHNLEFDAWPGCSRPQIDLAYCSHCSHCSYYSYHFYHSPPRLPRQQNELPRSAPRHHLIFPNEYLSANIRTHLALRLRRQLAQLTQVCHRCLAGDTNPVVARRRRCRHRHRTLRPCRLHSFCSCLVDTRYSSGVTDGRDSARLLEYCSSTLSQPPSTLNLGFPVKHSGKIDNIFRGAEINPLAFIDPTRSSFNLHH